MNYILYQKHTNFITDWQIVYIILEQFFLTNAVALVVLLQITALTKNTPVTTVDSIFRFIDLFPYLLQYSIY